MTQPLPLLIATDNNLLFAAATMLRSAQASLAPGFEFDVFAYVHEVPDAELKRLSDFCVQELGREPRLVTDESFSPEHQQLLDQLVAGLPRFPRPLWARLFLPALVTEGDRAVFADIDVAVMGDLSPLWNMPLNGHAVGAVHDPAPEPAAQLAARDPRLQRYFNAGMMAVDVPVWRRDLVAERATAWMLERGRKSHFPDQDALNVVLMADDGAPLWEELEPIWNTIGRRRAVEWLDGSVHPVPIEQIRLRHFAGPFKPWNTEQLPMGEAFTKHLEAVPFEVPLHMRTRKRPSFARRIFRQARRRLRPS